MNIVISNVYSNDNKGDAALLSVLIGNIRRAFGDPQITILTMDTIREGELFEGVPMKNSFMHYASSRYSNPLIKAAYGFFVTMSTFAWACAYRAIGIRLPLPKHLRDIAILYSRADLVIPVGGGYIRGRTGFMETCVIFFILHPLLFTYIVKIPTIGYTQSIGPFGNKLQEWMAKFTTKRLTGVIIREQISLDLLRKWNVTRNVLLSVDAGFLFTSDIKVNLRNKLGIKTDKMVVGITVRNWLKRLEQQRYEKTMAEFCDYIVKKHNASIIFISQVTVENHRDDDRESAKRVYDLMEYKNSANLMDERFDHRTIKAMYADLNYLIGTRFHSVIFALTSYVPAIAVGYEHKTQGIMNDLGLEDWVVDIRTVQTSQLTVLFDQLVAKRESYKNQLEKVLPAYIQRAQQSIFFIKDVYEKI